MLVELYVCVTLLVIMFASYIIFLAIGLFLQGSAPSILRFLAFLQMAALSSTPFILTLLQRNGLTEESTGVRLLEELGLHAVRYKVVIRPLVGYFGVYIDAFTLQHICNRNNNGVTYIVSKVHDHACDRATRPIGSSWIQTLKSVSGPVTAWINFGNSIRDVLRMYPGQGTIQTDFGIITCSYNRYYHGRRSSNTKPNGYWTVEDEAAGWVFHMGRNAQVTGRGGNHRSATGEAEGRAILDAHRKRLQDKGLVSAAERRTVMRKLWETADRFDIVIGKWSVYVPSKVADNVWEDLCSANDEGSLGGCIKLSPYNKSTDKFMMVVYCNDFTDLHDCQRILHIVHDIVSRFGVNIIANFKPDFFSRIGVYRNRLLGVRVDYPLKELGLTKFWPHPQLKRILDNLKGK